MILKILNLVFLIAMVYVNYLANSLPINSQTTGEISNAYSNLFTPAGITFSIWGIIYLGLAVSTVLLFKSSNKELLQSVSWFYIISSILNAVWIYAWHYNKFGLSVIIMLLLLTSLILINYRLSSHPNSIIKASFGIYLGWICIATIANITVWLVSLNWSGFGLSEEIWTILLIIIGLAITVAAVTKFKNPIIALSVIWAFVGISIKQCKNNNLIVIFSISSIVIICIWIIYFFYKKCQSQTCI